MDYFVRPVAELRRVPGNPAGDADYHTRLIKSRQLELESLRTRIIADLSLDGHDAQKAQESMLVLAGTGQLLISGSVRNVDKLDSVPGIVVLPDGPLPKVQYAAPPIGPRAAQQWHLTKINKPVTLTGAGFSIGVIDFGYDPTVPDLSTFTPTFADYVNGSPGNMAISTVPFDHSPIKHGSAVCAFLAGNPSGVAPGASIFVAGVPANSVLGNQSLVVVALNWLLTVHTGLAGRTTGCDIVTTSLPVSAAGNATPKAVEDALKQARVLRTLVVAAIGNTGAAGKTQGAGSSLQVLGVGAVNANGDVFGSAWGPAGGSSKPDIVAPGYQLELDNGAGNHDIRNGTSFAAPMVAGAAALVLERTPALRGNLVNLRTALLGFTTAPTSSPTNASGSGLLDLTGL